VELAKVIKYVHKKAPLFALYYHRAQVYRSGNITDKATITRERLNWMDVIFVIFFIP
jgi:hypothetical protein